MDSQLFYNIYSRLLIMFGLFLFLISMPLGALVVTHVSAPAPTFFASIDTMKVSRDTQTRPLKHNEILEIVTLSASLNTNYITVDTNWDYSDYMKQWIDAIRATNRHVWFRGHPNQWENSNGATGIMTLDQYEQAEKQFILSHPSFFRPGDIFDPCSEPEGGHYWYDSFGSSWTSNAPNNYTATFNAFLRDTTDVADAALHQAGIYGEITTIHSLNSFFATHPDVLERTTVDKFGLITIDSYPEKDTTDSQVAVRERLNELS